MNYWDKPVVTAYCDRCGNMCDPVGDRVGLNTHLHQWCRAPTRSVAVYAPAVYVPSYGSNTTWVITEKKKKKKKKSGDTIVWLSK